MVDGKREWVWGMCGGDDTKLHKVQQEIYERQEIGGVSVGFELAFE